MPAATPTGERLQANDASEARVAPADWTGYVAAPYGPQLVVGGPGSGKTEFLVRRIVHLVTTGIAEPSDLLILSFSRRGVADLDERLHRSLDRSVRGFDVSTFHSFSSRLLETHFRRRNWKQPPTVLAGPEQIEIVAQLLNTDQAKNWSPAFRSILHTHTFASEVTDFILRCREQLIDPADLATLAAGRADWRGLDGFMRRYDDELRRTSRIDYGTLLAEAAALLDPAGSSATDAPYRFVVVDEYQDTTPAQATLLRRLVKARRNIVAAADPYQSIYSFRGTDLGNVARFVTDFPDENGTPARRIVLTTTHRVPARILAAAERVTAHDLPGSAGTVEPAAGSGSVEAYRFEQETEEAEWIAGEALRMNREQRLPFSRMAVFVRSKQRFLAELSRVLDRHGIPHGRPDSRLADQPAVRFVLDCVAAASDAAGPTEQVRAIRRILLGTMFRLPLWVMRDVERAQHSSGESWPAAIRALVPEGGPLADLLENGSWATERAAVDGLWHLWSALPQTTDLVADPQRAGERAAWASLSQVLARYGERDTQATLETYRRISEDETFEASPLLTYRPTADDRMTLSTLHQAKGLEFDVVFIADAVEGVFPDLRPRDSLLGARHLHRHVPADRAGYLAFRLQEERRIAYTAMTRATMRVVWTATDSGFAAGGGIPSRFLALASGKPPETPPPRRSDRAPLTKPEFEASLVAAITDPERTEADRLAAATVLGSADDGLRPAETFYGVRERGPDIGLNPDHVVISPSQADRYESCPRRFALEHRLGIGPDSSIHARFGSLVHAVLEAVEAEAIERGKGHGSLAGAQDVLDRLFDPAAFGGEPFATSWRRRAREALERLYTNWPSTGSALAVEADLALETNGIPWRGRADRIERRDDAVAVVDYKTSKTAAPRRAAGRFLQLGFYLLAAAADPGVRRAGRPAVAELWYPLGGRDAQPAVRRFDPQELESIEDRMASAAEGIAAERWPATPSEACDRCGARSVCPAIGEGREAFSR